MFFLFVCLFFFSVNTKSTTESANLELWAHSADNGTLPSRADPGTGSPLIPRDNYVYILSDNLSVLFLIILVCIF